MYTALYRAYRPEVFHEVLGQEHVVKILQNQIKSDTVGHAYVFCGTRGTGKTTAARLLAKGVNCLSDEGKPCGVCGNCKSIKDGTFMDVIEIDAASNNGVENIRDLRESVQYPPAVGKRKVYIIDEVHMLSTGAFNALLKTLEEPPENVMFILATTESHKLPATILSRCLRLDFRRVPEAVLKSGMKNICQSVGIQVDDDALTVIAANADGSVRDGLSLLDQCLSAGAEKVTKADILDILGTVGEEIFIELTDSIIRKKTSDALTLLDRILADGKDIRQIMKDWVTHYRNLLVVKYVKKAEDMLSMSAENIERIKSQSDGMDTQDINEAIIELSKTVTESKWSTHPRILLEMFIVKLSVGLEYHPKAKLKEQVQVNAEIEREKSVPKISTHVAELKQSLPSQMDKGEMEELWNKVIELAEKEVASFSMVRSGAELVRVDDEEFTLVLSGAAIQGYIEKKKDVIEDIMQECTGSRRKLVWMSKENSKSQEKGVAIKNIENVKEEAEKALGGEIEWV